MFCKRQQQQYVALISKWCDKLHLLKVNLVINLVVRLRIANHSTPPPHLFETVRWPISQKRWNMLCGAVCLLRDTVEQHAEIHGDPQVYTSGQKFGTSKLN